MKTVRLSRRNVILTVVSAAVLPQGVLGQDREVEGGIGGTGIVGLLTDFGSLIVAGRRIETDRTTLFTDAFGPLSESNLALGDSLTVEAAGTTDRLIARRVYVTHPLVGTITAVNGRTAIINGVAVTLETPSPLARIGQRVAVSGLWRGAQVVASRLSPARATVDLVAGDVSRAGFNTRIGGVLVSGARLSGQPDGSYATVTGTFDTTVNRFAVHRTQTERFTFAAGPLRQLTVEGYMEPTPRAPGFRISGLGHSFARNLSLADFASSRVLFSGPYDSTFAADNVVLLSQDVAERRQVLRALARM